MPWLGGMSLITNTYYRTAHHHGPSFVALSPHSLAVLALVPTCYCYVVFETRFSQMDGLLFGAFFLLS